MSVPDSYDLEAGERLHILVDPAQVATSSRLSLRRSRTLRLSSSRSSSIAGGASCEGKALFEAIERDQKRRGNP